MHSKLKSNKINLKTVAIFALFLIFIIILFFKPIFVNQDYLFVSDLQLDFVTQLFAATSIQKGQIPLWDPYYYGPFLAYYNSAVFYPLNMAAFFVYRLEDLSFSFNIFMFEVLFHYFLAAVFMFFLMKKLKVGNLAALLSGLSYSFSGFMIGQMVHVQIFYAATYVPLLFFFFIKALHERPLNAIFSGIVLSIMFLAGHPQPTIYYCFLLLIFSAYCSYSQWRMGTRTPKRILKPLYLYLVCVGVAFGIAAIQLIPFFEFIPYSLRSSTTYQEMFHLGSIAPLHLITLLVPDFFGGSTIGEWGAKFNVIGMNETNYFAGIHAILFLCTAIAAQFLLEKKRIPQYHSFFLFTCLISLFLMLGSHTILSAWFYLMPTLNKMRLACRIGSVFNFSLAILIGFGLNFFMRNADTLKRNFNKKTLLIILSILLFIATCWIGTFAYKFFVHNEMFIKNERVLNIYSDVFVTHERLLNIYYDCIHSAIVAFLLIFCLVRIVKSKSTHQKIYACIFIVISYVNLFTFQANFYPRAAFSENPTLFSKHKDFITVEHLNDIKLPSEIANDDKIFRVRMPDIYDYGRYAQINKIFSLGYGGAVAVARLSNFRQIFDNPRPPYNIINPSSPLFDFYNVKYFYSLLDLRKFSKKFVPLPNSPGWFWNVSAFSRSFCVDNFKVFSSDEITLERIRSIDLHQYVVLHNEKPKLNYNYTDKSQSHCRIVNYSNNEVLISATMERPGFVVLTDMWYPGWKAYIDDKQTKLYRANYTFRAVEVPKGLHMVKFVYDPLSFKVGKIITFSTIFLLLLTFVIALNRKGIT